MIALDDHVPVEVVPYYNPIEIENWFEKWFGADEEERIC